MSTTTSPRKRPTKKAGPHDGRVFEHGARRRFDPSRYFGYACHGCGAMERALPTREAAEAGLTEHQATGERVTVDAF